LCTFYINISAPEAFDVIESNISPTQRKNLGEIAKILHQISTGKLFSGNEPYQIHLNQYIRVSANKFKTFLKQVQSVPLAEEFFEMNEFADSSQYKKPRIFISPEEIYQVHRNLQVYLYDLVFSFK
jgi:Ras GTPase-activating-like protein IQGAP2/3